MSCKVSYNELDMSQVRIIRQFQNVRFVLFQILVFFGDPQIGKRLSWHAFSPLVVDENGNLMSWGYFIRFWLGKKAHLFSLSEEKTRQNHLGTFLTGKTGGKNVGSPNRV